MQEEEARLKPGTTKHAAFMVLKACGGTEGLTTEGIIRQATERGIKTDWPEGGKRNLYHVRAVRGTWGSCVTKVHAM